MTFSFSFNTPIVTKVHTITQSLTQKSDLSLHWPVTSPYYQLKYFVYPYTKRFLYLIIISGTLLIPTDFIIN